MTALVASPARAGTGDITISKPMIVLGGSAECELDLSVVDATPTDTTETTFDGPKAVSGGNYYHYSVVGTNKHFDAVAPTPGPPTRTFTWELKGNQNGQPALCNEDYAGKTWTIRVDEHTGGNVVGSSCFAFTFGPAGTAHANGSADGGTGKAVACDKATQPVLKSPVKKWGKTSGKAKVKKTVKVSKPSVVSGSKVAYKWTVKGKKVGTKPKLKLKKAWKGKTVKVKVTVSKKGYKTVKKTYSVGKIKK